MATTLDDTIAQKQHSWLSGIVNSQTFWVLIAVILSCVFLSFATDSFATTKNLYNITRNVTFVAIIALGMTLVIITGGIDLSVGSVLCLCSMVLAVTMHAGYSIEVGILASIATALVMLGLSLGSKLPCLGGPYDGLGSSPDWENQNRLYCYSDLQQLWTGRGIAWTPSNDRETPVARSVPGHRSSCDETAGSPN